MAISKVCVLLLLLVTLVGSAHGKKGSESPPSGGGYGGSPGHSGGTPGGQSPGNPSYPGSPGKDPHNNYGQDCKNKATGCMHGDPVLVGGDGVRFYFHGHKDADFCLVSDTNLHVNAHFIGRRGEGRIRDFTWVQSLGIIYGDTQLYLGANKVGSWDDNVDQLTLAVGSTPVVLPRGEGATWSMPSAGLTITRLADTNSVSVQIEGMLKLKAEIVPVTQEEDAKHKYGITPDNCFAHFNLKFDFESLSSLVSGVLGQTYAPSYKSLVQIPGIIMPTMHGDAEYLSSSIMSTDCSVSKYGSSTAKQMLTDLKPMSCEQGSSSGMVCRR